MGALKPEGKKVYEKNNTCVDCFTFRAQLACLVRAGDEVSTAQRLHDGAGYGDFAGKERRNQPRSQIEPQ